MEKNEPKVKSSIVTRPAYKSDVSLYITSSVRWIGMLYVKGKKIYTTTDFDCEDAAFVVWPSIFNGIKINIIVIYLLMLVKGD